MTRGYADHTTLKPGLINLILSWTLTHTHTHRPTPMWVTLKLSHTHTHTHTHSLSQTHSQLVNSPNRTWTRSRRGYGLSRCGDCGEGWIKPWTPPDKQQDGLDLGIKKDTGMIRYVPLSFSTVHRSVAEDMKSMSLPVVKLNQSPTV